MTHRFLWLGGLFLAGGLLLSGCGGSSPVRVTGDVTLDGQPLTNGFVEFTPDDPTKGHGASCTTDDKGHFKLYPDTPHKVLVPGGYTVSFRKLAESKTKAQPGDAEGPNMARPNLVPRLYRDKSSPIKVTLKEGMNKLEPFALTSGKGAPPKAR